MVFDCAAEQGVCTGERRSETCAHVRSDAGRSGFWLSDRDPPGIPSAVVQPRPPVVAAAGPLDAPRDSVDLDGGPVIAPWNESPAPDEVACPMQPSSPTSEAQPGSQELPDRAERSEPRSGALTGVPGTDVEIGGG